MREHHRTSLRNYHHTHRYFSVCQIESECLFRGDSQENPRVLHTVSIISTINGADHKHQILKFILCEKKKQQEQRPNSPTKHFVFIISFPLRHLVESDITIILYRGGNCRRKTRVYPLGYRAGQW